MFNPREHDPKRRLLVKVLGASPVLLPTALAAACGEREKPNNDAIILELKQKLGITEATTREQFAQQAAQIATSSPQWMIGTEYSWTTNSDQSITYRVMPDGGFMNVKNNPIISVEYPNPQLLYSKPPTLVVSSGDTKNLVLYGTPITLDVFRDKEPVIRHFLDQYFSSTEKHATLHLSFLPSIKNIELLDIGNFGTIPQKSLRPATAQIVTDIENDKIKRFVIFYDIPGEHDHALSNKVSTQEDIVGSLANEMTNLLIRSYVSPRYLRMRLPEGVSTLAGLLAMVDKKSAEMILGGTAYIEFVKLIADEMNRIGKVRK